MVNCNTTLIKKRDGCAIYRFFCSSFTSSELLLAPVASAHAPTRTPRAVYSLPRTLSLVCCPSRYSSALHSQNTSPLEHRTAEPSDGLRILGTQSRLPSHRKKSWYRVATEFRACKPTDTEVVLKGNERILLLLGTTREIY